MKTARPKGKKRARKITKKKLSVKKRGLTRTPPGFVLNDENILVPTVYSKKPVEASKIRAGFDASKREIKKFIQEIVDTMNEEYQISEIELTASFNADGKFLGFGVGGAASIKFKISPNNKL